MDEEMVALDVNRTWQLVPLPEGKKAIGCKWVYKIKHKDDGTIERYKARLVAIGETELEHIKGPLKKEFDMKVLGELRYFLGLELSQKPHLDAVHHTLHFVRATLDHALYYDADVPMELHGYTDANWTAWLRKLLMDLRLQLDKELVIYYDNLSSIQLARNPVFHVRTKHIEVHYHFV
ncbi:hypothetical protein L7F22_029210 [Adiantum nelumboides]|nr:hypothetical protein [Adiantum nelumboides]